MIKTPLLITITLLSILSCSQNNKNPDPQRTELADTSAVQANKNAMTNYFPFQISDPDGRYAIIVETESEELYPKYAEFFGKRGYSGNGYCWEGHITQVLEKLNPALLQHIEFDPEAGAFYAYADTKENQIKIVELLSPVFSDLSRLEEYVKKADRSRIDD